MIGARALQIAMGAPMKVELTKKQLEDINYNPIEVAKLEFREGKIPVDVLRLCPQPDKEE